MDAEQFAQCCGCFYAQKKISRSEDRGYSAAEASQPRRARREEPAIDDNVPLQGGGKKKYYN